MSRRRDRFLPAVLAGVLATALAPGAAHAATPPMPSVVPAAAAPVGDQIIVRHRANLTRGERADLRAGAGVTLDRTLPLTGVELVQADGSRAGALAALRADPDVLWAEPNTVVRATTTDPYFNLQWGLDNTGATGGTPDADVDAPEAWGVPGLGAAARGAGVTVGVVDTGAQSDHPDLVGQLVTGANFAADGHTTADDGNGHGTHVAGIIAALADNGVGVSGLAPDAKVEPLRALGDNGSGSTAGVAAAFAMAGDQGLRVVNASLGSSSYSSAENQAITSHPNTLFVVAAGNDGANVDVTPTYPCAFPAANVVCVGASDNTDSPASFSNRGAASVDLFAPGVQIASTWLASGYEYASGTSMASPMVAAAAALVAAANPTWSPAQVKAALLDGVDHPAALAGLSVTGGRLNAAQALTIDTPTPTLTPTSTPTLTPTAGSTPTPTPTSAPAPSPSPTITPTPATGPSPTISPTASVDPPNPTPSPDGAAPTPAAAVPSPLIPVANLPDLPNAGRPVDVVPPTSASPSASSHLSRVRVMEVRGRPRLITFRLSAAGSVQATVQRRRRNGSRTAAVSRMFALAAGPQSLWVTGTGFGLGLHTGEWRVALRSSAGDVAVVWLSVR